MASHITLGKKGEEIAQAYLRSNQYHILEINWRNKHREVDIIAQTADSIVFVEVKTLARDLFGWPEQQVDRAKRKHLLAAAAVYLDKMQQLPAAIRFDIIAITFTEGEAYELVHFEDAF
jgi:putative endonuclease